MEDVMNDALKVYLNKPACNHINFTKDRPDNVIMKIADGYLCQDTVQGSWWLVDGPDDYNMCLLSWAYIEGANKQTLG